MKNFKKIVRIGKTFPKWHKTGYSVFCKIEYKDGRLSISGVEGPKANGDCWGSCGQIDMSEWGITEYAPGWSEALEKQFRKVWARWHLNDMKANCEHQTGPEWEPKDVNVYHFDLTAEAYQARKEAEKAANDALKAGQPFAPTEEQSCLASLPLSYSSHIQEPKEHYKPVRETNYSRPVETKKTNWLRADEHPEGYLSKPCPVCGYKYGSAWKKEDVPAEVLEFLQSLPETDVNPAWV